MKFIKILLLVLLVVILLYFFFHNLDLNEVLHILKGINPVYPLIFLAGLYAQFYIRAYRWGIILSRFKSRIPVFTLYNYVVIGFFLNSIVPGRLGEPARGILLANEVGIKKSHGLASVLMERMIDFLMIIVIFFSSLMFIGDTGSPIFRSMKKGAFILLPVVVVIFGLFYLINIDRMAGFVNSSIRFSSKILPVRFRDKWVESIGNFIKGLKLDLSLKNYTKLLISSILVWIWLIPFYWIIMKGFEFGQSVSLMETVPFFSIIVVSAAIPTPGMAGSLDAASKYGIIELYRNNVVRPEGLPEQAAAYTLLFHVLILLVIIIPGLVALNSKGLKIKSILGIKDKDEVS